MNATGIKAIAYNAKTIISENSPVILTGLGTVGVITTVIFAVKATPKAINLLDQAASAKYLEEGDQDDGYLDYLGNSDWPQIEVTPYFNVLTPTEILKATWKAYLPTVIIGGLSIACFIGSTKVSSVRNAALASAYSIADKTLRDYQSKVIDIIGDKKNQEIRDKVSEKHIQELDDVPNPGSSVIIPVGNGKILCRDGITNQYFMSDIETVRTAMNDFNHDIISDFTMTLNDWYTDLGLPTVEIGDELGWNADTLLDINFGSGIAPNGIPCAVLDYYSLPKPTFKEF